MQYKILIMIIADDTTMSQRQANDSQRQVNVNGMTHDYIFNHYFVLYESIFKDEIWFIGKCRQRYVV